MVIKLNYKVIAAVFAAVIIFLAASICIVTARQSPHGGSQAATHLKEGVCVPILMYHEVKYKNPGKDAILPYEFESDLAYLQSEGYKTITMSDLISYVYDGKALPKKPVILSFDDGYLNTYVYVFPMIKKYNAKIVLSVIGKSIDDFTKKPCGNINSSHATWTQIDKMVSSGLVEIQNHTYNMHKITSSRFGCSKRRGESQEHYARALTEDIEKLQTEIKSFTGFTPNTFTYPYGQVSNDSLPVIKSLGFKASLTCNFGMNVITKDREILFGLRRICRSHGVTAKKYIEEAMKTLKFRKDVILTDTCSD